MAYQPKSYRKFIAGAATAAVVAGSFAGIAGAASFSDIDGNTHKEAILALVDQGIIKGYPDGTFRPYASITRGDAAVMVARTLGILDGKNIPAAGYSDLNQVNATTQEAIAKLSNLGIVSGYGDGTFRPNETITRAQMAKYIAKAFDLPIGDGITKFTDVNPNAALAPFIDALADAEITLGKANGTFGYFDNLNRGDFSAMIKRALDYKKAPTPKPDVRNPITIEVADNKGNNLLNGEKKTYTVTITNPVSGKPVPNAAVNVTFAENIGTDAGSKRNVTVTDAYGNDEGIPYQADLKDGAVKEVVIYTDQHGKATFTITGENASVTPIVFLDGTNQKWDTGSGILDEIPSYKDGRFDKNSEFYAQAEKVTFSLEEYKLSVTAKGDKFAALAEGVWDRQKGRYTQDNGREYTVTVLKADGKPFAGGTVHVGISELLDQNPGNNPSAAYLVGDTDDDKILELKLDSEGKAKVVLASTADNDFASPIFWIDQDDNNIPNTFEKSVVGEVTNFQAARVQAEAKLEVNDSGLRENAKEFKFIILNQSGKEFPDEWYGRDKDAQATFEVKNTGSHTIEIFNRFGVKIDEVAPDKTKSIPLDVVNDRTLRVVSVGGPSSVEVSANAVIKWYEDGRSRNVAVTAPTKSADLKHSVDVKGSGDLRLLSVTPQDRDSNGTPEEFVFKFNTAVSGVEAEDFRLAGKSDKFATGIELKDDNKTVVVYFADTNVTGETTITYDGGYVNSSTVIKDGYGNTARPFEVPVTGYTR